MVDKLCKVVWTSDFVEDVTLAVEYVSDVLKSPIAARNLFDGVIAQLENVRALPTAAAHRKSLHGEDFYMISYKNFNIYYILEDDVIKAVGLKHQLQN